MNDAVSISEKADRFVSALLKDKLSGEFTYHNLEHTQRVVRAAENLAEIEKVPATDQLVISLAAWFHDTGYTIGAINHEQHSVQIFKEFAALHGLDSGLVAAVGRLILITEMCQKPNSLSEKILRDADSSHFGSIRYTEIADSLRKEWETTGQKTFSDMDWISSNLQLLKNFHRYQTSSANELWNVQKQNNISQLEKQLQHMHTQPDSQKPKKDKEKGDRSVETMFRVTLNNHTQLSQIADSKANILLSVNAVIISIALSTLIPKLDSPGNVHLIIPTLIMLLSSVTCIIFAILATRPKVSSKNYSPEDVKQRKVNLLFFGNFHQMPLADYQIAMKEMMNDRNYLYESMIRDLYLLGKVLQHKYKMLRITYTLFMIGITVSVFAFIWAFKSV